MSAEYRDDDDDMLDDSLVSIFDFREDVNARLQLTNQLHNIEFDSGRVGVGVLIGRIGSIAAAPRREQARSFLPRSHALSRRSLERYELLPSKTRTSATGDETSTETKTNTRALVETLTRYLVVAVVLHTGGVSQTSSTVAPDWIRALASPLFLLLSRL